MKTASKRDDQKSSPFQTNPWWPYITYQKIIHLLIVLSLIIPLFHKTSQPVVASSFISEVSQQEVANKEKGSNNEENVYKALSSYVFTVINLLKQNLILVGKSYSLTNETIEGSLLLNQVVFQVDDEPTTNGSVNEDFGRFNIGVQAEPAWDLLFRWPNPPYTSFTTLRIDGEDTIFGDLSNGIFVSESSSTPSLIKWRKGNVETTQTLSVVENPQTGENDAVKITYIIENKGEVSHNVGLRIMLDTEINREDGAPFRLPAIGILETEQNFEGSQVPDQFQVFDDLSDSQHVASATLRGGEATPPDRLVLAYWPNIYPDTANPILYNYTINSDQEITDDSAYALYWNPKPIAPGKSLTYTTYYGLGQFDAEIVSPLALGVSGPTSLSSSNGSYLPNPFDITATITNISNPSVNVNNVEVELNLPPELSLYTGENPKPLGSILGNKEMQYTWSIRAKPSATARTLNYSVTVKATNATPITVTRTISIPATTTPGDGTGPGDGEDCSIGSAVTGSQGFAGGPINTRTGEMFYSSSDISIQTTTGDLSFSRSYSTSSVDSEVNVLGPGWTHNHDIKLILPSQPGGVVDRVIFKGASTNLYNFTIVDEDEFIPFPGITATLTYISDLERYELTDCQQQVFTFDENGRLIERKDAQGHILTYSYVDEKLFKIASEGDSQYLTVGYTEGRITSITDQSGRSVEYQYSSTTGDLVTVKDLRDYLWTYQYDDSNHPHFLTHIKDPDQHVIEQTEYDALGRAVRQYNGNGEKTIELSYSSDLTTSETTIVDGLGNPQTHLYDSRGTLTSESGAENEKYGKVYDGNFRPTQIKDAFENTTNLVWSEDGFDLLSATDALLNTTNYAYDNTNHVSLITEADGKQTRFVYNNPGAQDPITGQVVYNPDWDEDLLLLTINNFQVPETSEDANAITKFFYTSLDDDPEPANLLRRIETPESNTCYSYNALGQPTHIYENCVDMNPATGPGSEDIVTSYTYDNFGRMVTITNPAGQVTRNVYHTEDDRFDATIRNYNPAKAPYEDGVWNLETVYVYDSAGRQIDTITNAYTGDLNHNGLTEPALVLDINRDGTPEYQLEIDPNQPEYNKISHTDYDAAGRVIESTINYWPGQPDNYLDLYNQSSKTVYDLGGNAIASIQMLPGCTLTEGVNAQGGKTLALSAECKASRTYYDASSRPISSVQNWKGNDLMAPTPPEPLSNTPDQNVRTDTVYDLNSNANASIAVLPGCVVTRSEDSQGNPVVDVTSACVVNRTYFDALNRPEFTVRNLVGKPIMEPAYNSAGDLTLLSLTRTADQNLTSQTIYDSMGQVIASIELLPGCTITRSTNANGKYTYSPSAECLVTRTYYDALGRPNITVENLSGQIIDEAFTTPPAYIPPDKNVPSSRPAYDDAGQHIASIDPLGHITRTYLDSLNRPWKVTQNLRDPLDPGATEDDLLALTNPPGYSSAHPDWNITTETRYDAFGRVIASIDPLGNVNRTYYDAVGRAYLTTRNLKLSSNPNATIDQLLALAEPPAFDSNHPDWNLTTQIVYNAAGQTIARIDKAFADCIVTQANGSVTASATCRVTRMYYDALGRSYAVVQNLFGQAVNDPNLPSNSDANPNNDLTAETNRVGYSIHNSAGMVIATVESSPSCEVRWNSNHSVVIDTDCVMHRTYYDELGRTKTVVKNFTGPDVFSDTPPVRNPAAPDQNVRTDFWYDSAGNQNKIMDPNGVITFFVHDRLGRLTDVYENYLLPYIPGTKENVHTIYTYDSMGNRLTIQSAKSVMEGTQAITTFDYDALGRLESESNPLGHTLRYGYNVLGQRVSQWDAYNLETKFFFDGVNRLVQIDYPETDPDVSFGYEASGQRKTMTDGLGTTTWDYDALGRAKTITDPFGKTVGYQYDGQGNRTRLTYPDQKQVNYSYDGLNRLETVTDWQNQQTQYIYDYDANGQQQVIRQVGSLTTTLTYNPVGRLTDLAHAWDGTSLATYQYTYDPSGNRVQAIEDLRQPGGGPAQFTAEAQGYMAIRLSWPDSSTEETGYTLDRRTDTDDAHWQRIAELPANTLTYVDYGLARHTRYEYRLTAVGSPNSTTLVTSTGFDSVDYDAASKGTTTSHTEIAYTYDPLYRLTEADYSDGTFFHYEYDANGNRTAEITQQGRVESVYDAANRLASVGGVAYTWDNNGNLTSDGVNSYAYNNANRLVSVTEGGETTSFAYNGLGDRLVENQMQFVMDLNAGLTQALWDGTNTYLYGNERIGQFTANDSAYFLGDALGSVRQLVDGVGAVALTKSYEPYGEVLSGGGEEDSLYGYTGEWNASSTNLLNLRARFYDTETGRFISRDNWPGKHTKSMSFNSWLYTYANPINFTDRTGHDTDCSPIWDYACWTDKARFELKADRYSDPWTGPKQDPITSAYSQAAYLKYQEVTEIKCYVSTMDVLAATSHAEYGNLAGENKRLSLEALGRQFFHFCGPNGECKGTQLWVFLGSQQGWYGHSAVTLLTYMQLPAARFSAEIIRDTHIWRTGKEWNKPWVTGNLSLYKAEVQELMKYNYSTLYPGVGNTTLYRLDSSQPDPFIILTPGQQSYWKSEDKK